MSNGMMLRNCTHLCPYYTAITTDFFFKFLNVADTVCAYSINTECYNNESNHKVQISYLSPTSFTIETEALIGQEQICKILCHCTLVI